MRFAAIALTTGLLIACSVPDSPGEPAALAGGGATIYPAGTVITMQPGIAEADAVAVRDGRILSVGETDSLQAQFPGAIVNDVFVGKTIVPGLIDPHVHMVLSSIQYALPLTPPWQMATPNGMVDGLPTREDFLRRLRDYDAEARAGEPLIIYGYHNLVFGELDRHDLDAITTERPLLIWHYSSHDFYLNTKALEWARIAPELHEQFEGIPLGEDGQPTGRVFEDALPYLLETIAPHLFAPELLRTGLEDFSSLLRAGGTTTIADLGYGIFGRALEDANIAANWISPEHAGYRLYLVPEHRAFAREFGDAAPQAVVDMVAGRISTVAPILPRVKFFTDGAFYSQTMRLSPPGYMAGQSEGSEGEWVTPPGTLADVISPYWQAGLSAHIHSNGDVAQSATLTALEELRGAPQTESGEPRFVIEHAGVFPPEQVERAAALGAEISAASHYAYYMSGVYREPLGEERAGWILPVGSLTGAGVSVTLHSDAPLAPPYPLRAASVHMTRATREGVAYMPREALDARAALAAITINAATALGLESEIGSIASGKLADFTILDSNPLETPGEDWPEIDIWGVVLAGELHPRE